MIFHSYVSLPEGTHWYAFLQWLGDRRVICPLGRVPIPPSTHQAAPQGVSSRWPAMIPPCCEGKNSVTVEWLLNDSECENWMTPEKGVNLWICHYASQTSISRARFPGYQWHGSASPLLLVIQSIAFSSIAFCWRWFAFFTKKSVHGVYHGILVYPTNLTGL